VRYAKKSGIQQSRRIEAGKQPPLSTWSGGSGLNLGTSKDPREPCGGSRTALRGNSGSILTPQLEDRPTQPGLGCRHNVSAHEAGMYVSGGGHGLAHESGTVLAAVKHHGS